MFINFFIGIKGIICILRVVVRIKWDNVNNLSMVFSLILDMIIIEKYDFFSRYNYYYLYEKKLRFR